MSESTPTQNVVISESVIAMLKARLKEIDDNIESKKAALELELAPLRIEARRLQRRIDAMKSLLKDDAG